MRTTTTPHGLQGLHAPAPRGSRAAAPQGPRAHARQSLPATAAPGGFAGFTGFYYPGGGRPGAGGAF